MYAMQVPDKFFHISLWMGDHLEERQVSRREIYIQWAGCVINLVYEDITSYKRLCEPRIRGYNLL